MPDETASSERYDERYARIRAGLSGRDQLVDRVLLRHPDALGHELQPLLAQVRASVLRDGDDESRAAVETEDGGTSSRAELARARLILSMRPTAAEQSARALVYHDDQGMTIALASPVPGANSRLAVRIATDMHVEEVYAGARRVASLARPLAERWAALGHAGEPHSVWTCDTPTWSQGAHTLMLELAPNPTGFGEAMYIASHGAGRTLVAVPDLEANEFESNAMAAEVMPSGWSYLRGDRTQGSCHPSLPNGSPALRRLVRVPDADLYAICAARTWPGTLRDAAWLRSRADFRAIR
jgi:hypothetical protein